MTVSTPADIVLFGPSKPVIVKGLQGHNVTSATTAAEVAALSPDVFARTRGVGVGGLVKMDRAMFERFAKLEIVSTFGVGYDHIDVGYAREHGIIVTNTPDVLTEETADTAPWSSALHGARFHQCRAARARGQMGDVAVPAEQGLDARPHRRHGRHGADRAERSHAGWKRCRCRSSIIRGGKLKASPINIMQI